jgi:hypothetical protein
MASPSLPSLGRFDPSSPLLVSDGGGAVLALGGSTILPGLVDGLRRGGRFACPLAVGFIAVLALADEFGWHDLLAVLTIAVPLILLIKDRPWYTRAGLRSPSSN